MKHFTPLIHLLRAAWEGDHAGCVARAQDLAERLEGEGDSAHARMLRFTMQSLQNRTGSTLVRSVSVPGATAANGPGASGADGTTVGDTPRARSPARDQELATNESVSLTFGRWEAAG